MLAWPLVLLPVFQQKKSTDVPRIDRPPTTWADQIKLFVCLATNCATFTGSSLESVDRALSHEKVFYSCRAVRRLLLGDGWYPLLDETGSMPTFAGSWHKGLGLIIDQTGELNIKNIATRNYIPVIYSMELTDQHPKGLRALLVPTLLDTAVDYAAMFRILIRYVTMGELDKCVASFLETVPDFWKKICEKNYARLFQVLRVRAPCVLPFPDKQGQLEFYKFNVKSFMYDWPENASLQELRKEVISNIQAYSDVLVQLFAYRKYQEIEVTDAKVCEYQQKLAMLVPRLSAVVAKRNPGSKALVVFVNGSNQRMWLICLSQNPVHRIVLCMSVARSVRRHKARPQLPPGPRNPHVVKAMLSRAEYAPKDLAFGGCHLIRACPSLCYEPSLDQDAFEEFSCMRHVCINNFKINIFNTNTVINTKIVCKKAQPHYTNILSIPRLRNNFVVRKYSVKEPSFTISVFYSDDLSESGAININISGDAMAFLLAMGNLKTFLPVTNIYPVSVANWNSTLDLQGLENQDMVRNGRNDVFWTTNFPSVVSTKQGFSVSWFKAATATVSKIHGQSLRLQIQNEALPILTDNNSKLNPHKNFLFTCLETRNRHQIQALHKRFLECLFECCSYFRLNIKSLRSLAVGGAFDFLKKTISHTKNKHESALLGYRKCNLIPKVFNVNKKNRLDELGRNANFVTFLPHFGQARNEAKKRILRHVFRTFGLHWRSLRYRHKKRWNPCAGLSSA